MSVAGEAVAAPCGFDKARRFGWFAAMFAFLKRHRDPSPVEALHARIVAASREPALYGEGGFPDTVEGRFEALTLVALVVLRRLRQLPAPADDVAQDLVDAVFAHLEVALRELGVGDMGIPKRMKALGRAFYDRAGAYDALLDAGDGTGLAAVAAQRLDCVPPRAAADALLALAARLAGADLARILAQEPAAPVPASGRPEPVA